MVEESRPRTGKRRRRLGVEEQSVGVGVEHGEEEQGGRPGRRGGARDGGVLRAGRKRAEGERGDRSGGSCGERRARERKGKVRREKKE